MVSGACGGLWTEAKWSRNLMSSCWSQTDPSPHFVAISQCYAMYSFQITINTHAHFVANPFTTCPLPIHQFDKSVQMWFSNSITARFCCLCQTLQGLPKARGRVAVRKPSQGHWAFTMRFPCWVCFPHLLQATGTSTVPSSSSAVLTESKCLGWTFTLGRVLTLIHRESNQGLCSHCLLSVKTPTW